MQNFSPRIMNQQSQESALLNDYKRCDGRDGGEWGMEGNGGGKFGVET